MDLTQKVLRIDGKVMKYNRSEEVVTTNEEGVEVKEVKQIEEDLTFGVLIFEALLMNDEELDDKRVEARYKLYEKTDKKDEVEFTPAEKKLIREQLCKRWSIQIAGQLLKFI
jgi:hypothetical protein